MNDNYTVEMDEGRGLLRVRVAGFWAPEVSQGFVAELATAAAPSMRAGRSFAVLVDARDFPIQTADVGAQIAQYLEGSPNTGKRAIVMGSMLGKLQAERVLAHPRVRVFLSEAEAMDWLADELRVPPQ